MRCIITNGKLNNKLRKMQDAITNPLKQFGKFSNLTLITAPSPILRQKATEVENVDEEIQHLMNKMLNIMYESSGIGLAAPQVGVSKRVITLDLSSIDIDDSYNGFAQMCIANPKIIEASETLVTSNEACLSLPEQVIEVTRPSQIKLSFLDFKNKQREIIAKGWFARCLQHEMDHLNGKLLIDYLTPLKKDSALRKLKKIQKNNAYMKE